MIVLLVSAAEEALNAAHVDGTLLPLRLPTVHERTRRRESRCKPQPFNTTIKVVVVASVHAADSGGEIVEDGVRPRSALLIYPKGNTCFFMKTTLISHRDGVLLGNVRPTCKQSRDA